MPLEFSERAKTATNLPKLKSSSLLAVGPLCDDGKIVIFDQNNVHAIDDNDKVKQLLKESNIYYKVIEIHLMGVWIFL